MDIHWELCVAYGNNVMNEKGLRRKCTNVYSDAQDDWPNVVTHKLVEKMNKHMWQNL